MQHTTFLQWIIEGSPTDLLLELSLGGLTRAHRKWIPATPSAISELEIDSEADGYFGPALRKAKEPGKKGVAGSTVCWVDIDTEFEYESMCIPASAIVRSGHGYHCYWKLTGFHSPQEIEKGNRILAELLGADNAYNADRLLRLPNTMNLKREPVKCETLVLRPNVHYPLKDLFLLEGLDGGVASKIETTDSRGYRSKSERDWAIIAHLVELGLSEETIFHIFGYAPCGEKFREEGEHYLKFSIRKAQHRTKANARGGGGFQERENCYYVHTGKSIRQVSFFVLRPTMLVKNPESDIFVVDVYAHNTEEVWRDVAFPVTAFSSSREFNKYLVRAEWVWLGTDKDVRALQIHLLNEIREGEFPVTRSTDVLGRHVLPSGKAVVVGENTTISEDRVWKKEDAPLRYIPIRDREHPKVDFSNSTLPPDFAETVELLTQINVPEIVYPIAGWFFATPFKPLLFDEGFRFPCLVVYGTKGSGKTTTIQQVFQPLIGYTKPGAWDVKTTSFVTLTLLGSSTTIPIAFSEFRVLGSGDFIHYVLLAYDTGKDARGRPDQTTIQYPLTAPFCLDGEDRLDEPAAIERAIMVRMNKETVAENSPHFRAFRALMKQNLYAVATPYQMWCLSQSATEIEEAYEEMIEAFPQRLPDRVRKNFAVVWFGIKKFAAFCAENGVADFEPADGPQVLRKSLFNVYNLRLGRPPLAVDTFCEFVVNMASRRTEAFPWEISGGVLWFQLTPAFEMFNISMSRQKRDTLSRDSIKDQIMEIVGEYGRPPEIRTIAGKTVLAYGIDLKVAAECGLDIPSEIVSQTITINF